MDLPKSEFRFDYLGHCAWVDGCGMEYSSLPISDSLMKELHELCDEYDNRINWDDPNSSVPWTEEHKKDFKCRAAFAGKKLQEELCGKYAVINCFEEYIEK